MTNSLSPKTPLNQETLERVLVALRQPFAIAVLASLAAHGLLWAALPNMFDQKKEPEPQRKVQVVELSAAERGQLPPLGINPVPQTLLPTKPLQPTQSGTKLPDPKQYNDPLLDTFPIIPPPTFPFAGLPPSIFDSPTLPKRKPQNAPSPQPIASSKATPKPTPTSTGDSAQPSVNPTEPARSNNSSPPQKIAALQAEQRQLQALYAFNGPTNLTERTEIGNQNFTKLIESAAKLSSDTPKTKYFGTPLGIVSTLFPKEACLFVKQETIASIAAIVAPDGKLAELPSVFVPSGFKGLDNAAIEYVEKNYNNPDKKIVTDGAYQLIRFNFIFNPKAACPNSPNAA